jgi:uncharacterized membrane protein
MTVGWRKSGAYSPRGEYGQAAGMEEIFKRGASFIAFQVEAAAALIILAGAVEAFIGIVRSFFVVGPKTAARKRVWLRFGVWLLLGLEFELAADVVRTAISPRWSDIAQLASIALIRTFLNYFLEKDLEKYEESGETPA